MARLVSTALVKGLVRSSRPSRAAAVSQTIIQQFMKYSSGLGGVPDGESTTSHVAADPDTHQDFQPTSKSSGSSLHDIIDQSPPAENDIVVQDIKKNPVMIYMKGCPDAPRCGFSSLAVKVLRMYGIPIASRDILMDLNLKERVKAHSNWPTFPQVFIKGEFVGGSDIVLTMHQKGELKDLLADIAQEGGQDDAA